MGGKEMKKCEQEGCKENAFFEVVTGNSFKWFCETYKKGFFAKAANHEGQTKIRNFT